MLTISVKFLTILMDRLKVTTVYSRNCKDEEPQYTLKLSLTYSCLFPSTVKVTNEVAVKFSGRCEKRNKKHKEIKNCFISIQSNLRLL
jgi:hypothetical protein